MKSRPFLWTICFGLLANFFAWEWSNAQDSTTKAKPRNWDLIQFEAKAVPEDPFDPNNQHPAEGTPKVRRGQVVKIVLTGTPKTGYHTYPVTKRTGKQNEVQLSTLQIGKASGITPLWPIVETEPEKHFEKAVQSTLFEHFKTFTWAQDVLITSDASPGVLTVPIKLDLQVCNVGGCTPITRKESVALEVTAEEPMPPSQVLSARLATKKPSPEVVSIPGEVEDIESTAPRQKSVTGANQAKSSNESSIIEAGLIKDTPEEYKVKIDAIAQQIESKTSKGAGSNDLLQFVLAGIFWGAISLITPCVFPMIPITVSFFLKQSEKEHHRPIIMASVYSLTIVIVLTLAAAFLLSIFRWLSVHPVTNYFLGALFIFFALSLFGMYEIELPSSLAQFTSAREGKGGLIGTIFMALTFTIISFACVAPFLGGFSGTAAASRPLWHNLLGGLAFSATFASPFFFLALFPALLRKMPKSGSWLNSVKVVMGFLELAAAFKFFRSAELIQTSGNASFFTFDLILGLWIALCALAGLYLLGVFRLPHDSPEDHISVPRLLFSGIFLGLAFYLGPALFKVNVAGQPQRPGGVVYAWIDSFLLPEYQGGESDVIHTANLDYAVTTAREERKKTGLPKRIFIDFTGVTCTNCNQNEHEVFSRPAIAKLFDPYLVVRMYTDVVPTKYYVTEVQTELAKSRSRALSDAKEVNLPFQLERFGTEQLPLYVILEPDLNNHIRVIAMYEEGLINNVQSFAEFLKHPDKYQQGH